MNYLSCIKRVKGMNDPDCRSLARSYLGCRMDKNLMAKDEFKNLGFGDNKTSSLADAKNGKGEEEERKKGELRW